MMVIYLPVKFEFDRTNRFRVRVRKQKCGQSIYQPSTNNYPLNGITGGQFVMSDKRNVPIKPILNGVLVILILGKVIKLTMERFWRGFFRLPTFTQPPIASFDTTRMPICPSFDL